MRGVYSILAAMKLGTRIVAYVAMLLLAVGPGILGAIYYYQGRQFLAHMVNTTCVTLKYSTIVCTCGSPSNVYQLILNVSYANYSGVLRPWNGDSAAEVQCWAEKHYPIGGNFSCVYSALYPSDVRTEVPEPTVWLIVAMLAVCTAAGGAGSCLAGELHHANPQGLCAPAYTVIGSGEVAESQVDPVPVRQSGAD
jgi:hypothetical protein